MLFEFIIKSINKYCISSFSVASGDGANSGDGSGDIVNDTLSKIYYNDCTYIRDNYMTPISLSLYTLYVAFVIANLTFQFHCPTILYIITQIVSHNYFGAITCSAVCIMRMSVFY